MRDYIKLPNILCYAYYDYQIFCHADDGWKTDEWRWVGIDLITKTNLATIIVMKNSPIFAYLVKM